MKRAGDAKFLTQTCTWKTPSKQRPSNGIEMSLVSFYFFPHTGQFSWSEGGEMMDMGIDKVDWIWMATTLNGIQVESVYRQDGRKTSKGSSSGKMVLVHLVPFEPDPRRVGAGTFHHQGEFLVDW